MKIDVKSAGLVAASLVALGAAGTAIALGGHHSQQPTPIVVRQDAAIASATTTHTTAAATHTAAAKPVVKKPAAIQEATPVTDPTDTAVATAPAAGQTTQAQQGTEPGATQGPNGGPLPSMASYSSPPPPPPVLPGPTNDNSPTPAPSS